MKRKISFLLAMALMLGTLTNVALAEDAVPADTDEINEAVEEESGVLELSMDEAVKLATESDRGMWKIDDGIKQAQDARRSGKSAKDQAEMLMGMSLDTISAMGVDITSNYIETLLAKNGYYVTYADTQMKQLEKNRGLLLKGIEISTKSLYYNVLLAEKSIEINEAKLDKANEQLRVVNLKFDNGSATKAEVLNGEMAVQQAKTDLDSAMDDLNMAKLDLLNKLDLPFDQEIVLTDTELTYVPTAEIDLDAVIEKAKEERPEILKAENDLELQEIETHAYKAYYTSNLRQHKAAVEKLKDAELNVPQAYKDVELDVRKAYLNLIKAERSLVNMDKTVELATEAARINKLLYDNGMATSLEVIDADTNLAQAEIGRYQLLAAYNISKLMFDNSNLMGSSGLAQ
ncbi:MULTISPECIES: TolC family protein [unclassified Sedimentibacter]|uniref:TolC family protein n=1 Tax=unclassified Sedimentibacter TaxID=2649220 RepID=UPI0027DF9874|nr:TolC family protein [Sedimentibacter sp. MB35-C1]WMJ77332.1 TolC family protein [Sedimentibacter sp. MB35-C1]